MGLLEIDNRKTEITIDGEGLHYTRRDQDAFGNKREVPNEVAPCLRSVPINYSDGYDMYFVITDPKGIEEIKEELEHQLNPHNAPYEKYPKVEQVKGGYLLYIINPSTH